jgi:hypothetical protein
MLIVLMPILLMLIVLILIVLMPIVLMPIVLCTHAVRMLYACCAHPLILYSCCAHAVLMHSYTLIFPNSPAIQIWSDTNPAESKPVYTWRLKTFWDY